MALVTAASELAIAQNLKQFLVVLSISLSVATLPRLLSWFRQIPYTLLLVIVGLGLALVDVRLIDLSPGLILFIFLPPLLFEAAWNLRWSDLSRDLVPICLYAVGGVIISIAGVALSLNQLAGVSLTTALLVGASLAATDSASVVGLFREIGAEKRLTALMEGESLFNDGASVVAFSFLVSLASGTDDVQLSTTLMRFLAVVGIGMSVGGLIGFGVSYVTQRLDLPWVEQSLTLVSAYGSYLLVEELGGSGIIGVVTVGLILGNFGSRGGMNPRVRQVVTEFWEFLAFFVNSIIFLLIGDQICLTRLIENWGTTAVAIGAVILARAIAIYGLGGLSNGLANSQIPLPEQTVLWWGGLRGSISIALALSVPTTLLGREEVIANVFGVVLFTLLVQGLTTKPLLEKLQLVGQKSLGEKISAAILHRIALNRLLDYLIEIDRPQELEPEFNCYQAALTQVKIDGLQEDNPLEKPYPQLQAIAICQLREELLAIRAASDAELPQVRQLSNQLPLQTFLKDRDTDERAL